MQKKNILLLTIYSIIISFTFIISFSCTPEYSTEPGTNDTTSVQLDTIKYIDLWTMQSDTLFAIDTTSTFTLYADCRNDTGIVQDSTVVRFYSNIGIITAESYTNEGEANAVFSPFNSSGGLEAGNLTIIASSTIEEFVSDTLSFYVKDATGNNAPVLSTPIPDLLVNEDFEIQTVTLSSHFTDPDGDELVYSIESYDSLQISGTISGSLLIINSVQNWNGISTIKIRATEYGNRGIVKKGIKSRSFVETTFDVIVSPMNDDPILIHALPDTTVAEDFSPVALYLDLYFSDPDGDLLTFSITESNSAEVSAEVDGNVLIINPVENWNGVSSMTIKAQDSKNRLYIEDSFNITISAVNDAPYISTPIPNETVDEDFTPIIIDLDNHFSDVDTGDILSYTLLYNDSSEINCLLDGSSLLITSNLNWNGTSEVGIECSDGTLSVESSFDVLVSPVNDAPYLSTLLPDTILTMNFDPVIINLNNYFTDPDGEILTYTYELENDSTFNFQLVDNIVVITSLDSITGNSSITITADDLQSSKATVQDIFNVIVTNGR